MTARGAGLIEDLVGPAAMLLVVDMWCRRHSSLSAHRAVALVGNGGCLRVVDRCRHCRNDITTRSR